MRAPRGQRSALGHKTPSSYILGHFRFAPESGGARSQAAASSPRADLLSNYLSERFIDPVLPTRASVLKVIKDVPVNSQRDKLLGIWDGRTLWREFRGLRGCRFKRRFSRGP